MAASYSVDGPREVPRVLERMCIATEWEARLWLDVALAPARSLVQVCRRCFVTALVRVEVRVGRMEPRSVASSGMSTVARCLETIFAFLV